MDADGFAAVVIDCAVRHLGEFPGEGGGVGGSDLCVAQRQHQLLFQVRVFFLFILGKPNRVFTADQLWHLQVVGGLHRDGDVRNLSVDGVLCIGQGFVGVDDLAVSLVRREVIGAVLGDEPSKPLPHVQDAKLRPQIHQTVGRRSAGQSDDAAHLWSDL